MTLNLRNVRDATVVVLALRALYSLVLFVAQYTHTAPLQAPRRPGPPEGLAEWLHWIFINPWLFRDALYYVQIADAGYVPEAGHTAFHPLFPALSWLASLPFGSPGIGTWIASTVSAIALTVMVARYTAERYGEEWGTPAAAALLAMPVGFVWLLFYTDALFVAFAVGFLLYAHRGKWWAAALCGALATLTRQQGIVLALPLAVEVWRRERSVKAFASIALIPAAYAGFTAYRFLALGDVDLGEVSSFSELTRALLVSSNAEEIATGQRIAWPWEPFLGQFGLLLEGGGVHLILDAVLGLGMLAFIVAHHRQMSRAELLYCAGAAGVALCYYNGALGPYMALPRHIIIIFPVGYLVARYLRDKPTRWAVAGGIAFNCVLALLYGTSRWIP